MMLWGHAGRWSLFILAAVIPAPGVRLQTDGASVRPASEAHIYQPVTLQRSEAAPPIGTYTVKNPAGKPCIKATVGVQYIVMQKTMNLYSNLDPFRVSTTGYCSDEAAVLSLTLPHNTTSLQLTFRKENNLVYVTELNAHVSPLPTCQGCPNKTYSGLLANEKLFAAASGQSFKCKSENLLLTSQSGLWIKLVPLQLQAFTLPTGQYGEEVECWADYNKRVIPIILGAMVVGVILIAMLTFLLIRDRRREGYTQL